MAIAVYLLDAMISIYLGVLRAVFVMPMWRNDAEDLLSIARELESSSNIVHINGKEYTGKKSWIANRLREIVASAPIDR